MRSFTSKPLGSKESNLLSEEQLREIRQAFKDDPTLIKIRRFYKSESPDGIRKPRTDLEVPFTALEEKLKLTSSVIAAYDNLKNKKLFLISDNFYRKTSEKNSKVIKIKQVISLDPIDKVTEKKDSLSPEIVKIKKRSKGHPSYECSMDRLSHNELFALTCFNRNGFYARRSSSSTVTEYHFQKKIKGYNLKEYYEIEKKEYYEIEKRQRIQVYDNTVNLLQLTMNLLTKLKEFHERGFLHRDIKLENIMRDGIEVEFIDFEAAIMFRYLVTGQYTKDGYKELHMIREFLPNTDYFFGTRGYEHPAIKKALDDPRNTGKTVNYNKQTDIYAMGVVLRHLWNNLVVQPVSNTLKEEIDSIIYFEMMSESFLDECEENKIDVLQNKINYFKIKLDNYNKHPENYNQSFFISPDRVIPILDKRTEIKKALASTVISHDRFFSMIADYVAEEPLFPTVHTLAKFK